MTTARALAQLVTDARIWLALLLLRGLNVTVLGPGTHDFSDRTWKLPANQRLIGQDARLRSVSIQMGGHYPGRWPALLFGRR